METWGNIWSILHVNLGEEVECTAWKPGGTAGVYCMETWGNSWSLLHKNLGKQLEYTAWKPGETAGVY